ncbi:hypothetical protein EDC45_0248 [Mesocricetibacter intestinalis]|uniref:Uncharacterized protein n=1 Tax=Mesocricetibacter intestinalis TaxID=1521930 RepID=A0A4R6VFP9_9PAST|nr:hypothetical protein [Mesocricetibacter intestinalis]TDQ59591.1 hypothetical protein EDC45_0248 [Mesocricetibacter intestinalis]
MRKFFKKYYIGILFIITFATCISYIWLWSKDLIDDRYYPISLSEKNEIVIDYKTPLVISESRFFNLEFIIRSYKDIEYYNDFYLSEDNSFILKEKEFYSEINNKPKLNLKIFKDGDKVMDRDFYAMYSHGVSKAKINNKKYLLSGVDGVYSPGEPACFNFCRDPNIN